MATALQTLTNKLADRFDMGDGTGLTDVLTNTAFRGQKVSQDQMTALLVVANQYGLNPWTNEVYAFPNNGGIVPIVGVDGWARIMNEHPQYDGMDFSFSEKGDSCTCTIYRKDRSRPIIVTEYMAECQRNTQPWKSHPKRMLRHKAMIQCARLAFGFTGIYDQDEAEQIEQITQLVEVTQSNMTQLLAAAGRAPSLEKVTKANAKHVIEKLLTKLDKQQAQDEQLGEDVPIC